MKVFKKIAWVMLVALIVIQFIKPDRNLSDGPMDTMFRQETNPSAEVLNLLKDSCYDCHSNRTSYPWYSNVAPVSYWIADHIEHGKGHLNFSTWESYDKDKKDHKLEEIVETLEEGEMPLWEYTWTHSEARLTDEQQKAVIQWAETTRALYQLGHQPQ